MDVFVGPEDKSLQSAVPVESVAAFATQVLVFHILGRVNYHPFKGW